MEGDSPGWFVVANPVSGRGRALRLRPRIEAAFARQGLSLRFAISERHGHAPELVQTAISQGFRKFVAVGGDGTLNEVVNGACRQALCDPRQLTLAVLPLGTGNDFARGIGIPSQPEAAVALLHSGVARQHDVGLARFAGDRHRRYFINVAGVGFDAAVVARMPAEKRTLTYVGGLLGTLASYRCPQATIRVDGEARSGDLFVAFACLGPYCGGGMRVAPGALADDGLFDLTVVGGMSRLAVLASLRRLFDGSILDHPRVSAMRGRTIEVEAPQAIGVELDGEWGGRSPVRFEILPGALAVVHPPGR